MRVLFLISVFIPLIMTVHAQRSFSQYTCEVSYKHSQNTFYLNVGARSEVEVGGWKVIASIRRVDQEMEVSLSRAVNIMDATYEKVARKKYPLNARLLPVELRHSFGGKLDIFNMTCYPRDP